MPPNNKLGALLIHFLPWYKTEKDNIKRDYEYIKNGFQLAHDAMAR